jgi:DNA polymerase
MVERRVTLAGEADRDGFRHHARECLAQHIEPRQLHWHVATRAEADLFATTGDPPIDPAAMDPTAATAPVSVPAFFPPLCEHAALHADPGRYALLYRLLWRLVHEPALRHDTLDPDRQQAESMAGAVRRDMHKMV